jgi:hypothetical protein
MNPNTAVPQLNSLLQRSAKLNTVVVTDRIFETNYVFKGVDRTDPDNPKPIIVKTTAAPFGDQAQLELPHLQPYVRLSEHCNICKLLKYEVVGPVYNRKLITVMENCGVDLFTFMIDFIQNQNGKINLTRILSISLDLLNQIICLQSQNAVHGDIKIENVLIDDTGKATLVDFDELPTITQDATGVVHVSKLIVTAYNPQDDTFMARASTHYASKTMDKNFIMVILSISDLHLYPICNIPPGINDLRTQNVNFTLPNREHANIIDLYSWCYVILILLWVVRNAIDNVFRYRALLAIIMSIILPNADPKPVPVDAFDIPINADYRRRLVLGITVLLSDTTFVANESCTNYKVRLFLKLMQRCDSEDELSRRFNSIVAANSVFYDTNTDDSGSDEAVEMNESAFDVIDGHISAPVSAPGGRRRRRTHKKTKTHRPHACKKGKRASKFKRMTRRVR